VIYNQRRKILNKETDLKENILTMIKEEIQRIVDAHITDEHGISWDTAGLVTEVNTVFPLPRELDAEALSRMSSKEIEEKLIELAEALYEQREKEVGPDNMRMMERLVMLRIIDNLWVEHLTMMEHMRLEAGWQTLRQTRAVDAYKREGYKQFQVLLDTIQHDVAHTIYHVNLVKREAPAGTTTPMAQAAERAGGSSKLRPKTSGKKTGRNEPCPCGSGKKYKHCCGR
ncbi:unnamed protein product, partial [marine sediment metagenome]